MRFAIPPITDDAYLNEKTKKRKKITHINNIMYKYKYTHGDDASTVITRLGLR